MTFSYISKYDSPVLKGSDVTERPWDLNKVIIEKFVPESKLLDIGCGSAIKLVLFANYFSKIIGIDISKDMICSAKELLGKSKIDNIKIYAHNT